MRNRWTIQITDREVRAWRYVDPLSNWKRLTAVTAEKAGDDEAQGTTPNVTHEPFVTRSLERWSFRYEPEQLAAVVVEMVHSVTTGPVRGQLLIPACWCYVHAIDVPQRRPTQAALEFALEEFLPVPIEALTCSFLRQTGSSWLGIAVETNRIKPLLEHLHEHRIEVDSIAIDALEAGRCLATGTRMIWVDAHHRAEFTSARDSPGFRVLRMPSGTALEAGTRRAVVELGLQPLDAPGTVMAGPASGALQERWPSAMIAAQFRAPNRPGVELARDCLSPAPNQTERLRTFRKSATAVLACLVVVIAGLEWRQARVREQLLTLETWERGLYGTLFPGERVPAGVALRIQSERRRLEGLTMAGGDVGSHVPDALELLRQLVAAVPANLRINLQELRLESNDVMLRGFTVDPGQAERLTQAIGALPGLQAGPPRTDRAREGGVQFFVQASSVSSSKKEPS